MMRWLERAHSSDSGFQAQLPTPNRIKDRAEAIGPLGEDMAESLGMLLFEVGTPTKWYFRQFYLCGEEDGTNLGGECFTDGLRSVYTMAEARAVFLAFAACRCCAVHMQNRPSDPFLPTVATQVPVLGRAAKDVVPDGVNRSG